MRRTPLGLLFAAALAVFAAAADSPAPELVRLDGVLTEAQQAREQERVTPGGYAEFLTSFRADLGAAVAAAGPSPANTALHARILARLGEGERAAANLERALKEDPGNPSLRIALSQIRFDEKNYPAALAEADAALKSDPGNKEALALKHFSEGRVGPSSLEPASAALTARKISARSLRFAAVDPERLPFKLPIKIAPAPAPPDLIVSGEAPLPASPGPAPLLALAGAASLGFAAFGVSRSKYSYVSADGLDDAHPVQPGLGQSLVAGAILAGAAGAAIYLFGVMAVSAAPAALGYITSFGSQGISQNGSKAINEVPEMLARVIPVEPGNEMPISLGRASDPHAFVTAAEDIAGLNSAQIAQKLGIKAAEEYIVIRFPAPQSGFATPLEYDHVEFIGRGLTSGGAREFLIPNSPLPDTATVEIVK